MHRGDVAPQTGEYAKTKIGKLRRELVDIGRRGHEMERSGMTLLEKLVGGRPGHAEKKIGADAALNAAPSHGARTKHDEQDDADIEKQSDGGENAPELMKKRGRMDAPCPQYRRVYKNNDDYECRGEAALVYGQRTGNHERDHNEIEEEAPGKTCFAKRSDHKKKNHKRDGDKSKAKVARPELAHVRVENCASCRMRIVGHEGYPPKDRQLADDRKYIREDA